MALLRIERDPDLRQFQRTLALIWLAALALVLLTCWHVADLVKEDRQRQWTTAESDLANLTRVSQEHASRTLRSADQVIRFIQARYLEIGNKLDLTDLTRRGVIDAEIFNQVGVIDAKGIYVLANLPVTGKLDLSDREHFRVHVAADTGELFISRPVVGRASGKWSIQLTRRITRANGEFAGVVVVSIDPTYFSDFYGDLKLGPQGVMALLGMDGIGRARRIGDAAEFGKELHDSPMIEAVRQGQLKGSYTRNSSVDQVERLYFYRKIPGYPLIVAAGVATQDLLDEHLRARKVLMQQGAMLIALTLALAIALTRYVINIRRILQDRQAAQQEVLERTDQLDAIFALSPDGFMSFDRERRVKFVNPAFCQMTGSEGTQFEGLAEQELSAWLADRCTPGSPFPGLDELRARLVAGKPEARTVIEISSPIKRTLQVGLRIQDNSSVSQILYFRDITVEAEVDAMKSEFMATAAHELRTPMTSILGFTELLLNTDNDVPTQRDYLGIVLRQSKLMASILDELLDLARIEARRGKDFRYTRVELRILVSDIAKSVQWPTGRDKPELLLPAQELHVMADARKLQQAIVNVLTNAYKYSTGKVSVTVRRDSESGTANRVCIGIHDQGIGMNPEQVGRVFDRFYRADTSGKVLGTGLGMSIVKEIIDLHQGTIEIDSAPGVGTTVWLCLPGH